MDPFRIPLWYLEILAAALPALQAEEAIAAAAAARSAMLDTNDYRRMMDRLSYIAQGSEEQPIRMAETQEEKQQAAEFFAALGIKTE